MTWWSEYIGKPYEANARGPEAFDCWGLVETVFREALDIGVPSYGDIDTNDLLAVARKMHKPEDVGPWVQAHQAETFDVMLASQRAGTRRPGHVGIMVNSQEVLHVWKGTNVCVMRIDHDFLTGRVLGFYRHREIAC
ncbi:MAG: NlpC/P60 family protein [Pseudomonadota bacterium]